MSPFSLRNSSNNGTLLAVFSFLIGVLLALINLKFLPENVESPFETGGLVMPTFVITILVYAITLLCSPFSSEVTHHFILLSGSLGPVFLAFILYPSLGRFLFLVWVVYFVKLIYYACRKLYHLYKQISSFSGLFDLLRAHPVHHDEETIPYFTSRHVFRMNLDVIGLDALMAYKCNGGSTARNHGHAILGFPMAVLLALMPLKFRSMNMAAPFDTHSDVISIFVIVTVVYAGSWAIEAKLETGNNSIHQLIISKISLLSGSLVTVFLVLVIVPALGWFVLVLWTFFLVKIIYDASRNLHHIYQAISSASDVFDEVLGRGARRNEPGTPLPV